MKQQHTCQTGRCPHGCATPEEQEEIIRKHGWLIQYFWDDPHTPCNVNYNTHGLFERYGHPDLQFCLNIQPELVHRVFHGIVSLIAKGFRFEVGKEYDNVLAQHNVQFVDAWESGRKVLRLIVPDENGRFDTYPYSLQFTKLGLPPS